MPPKGIAAIAEGDDLQDVLAAIPAMPDMPVEELHPDDQDLIWWWEQQEPATSPLLIDPVARMKDEMKRKKK